MSLFIVVDGEKIKSYGKNGDIEIAQWPQVNGQPASKKQCYWDGSTVKLKSELMLSRDKIEERLPELVSLISNNWVKSTKNVTQIKEKFDLLKSQLPGLSTVAQVNYEIDTFISWLELS